MKKFLGIIFLIAGFLLFLVAVGNLTSIFSAFFGIIRFIDSQASTYDKGDAVGNLSYWLFHLILIFVFVIFGIRYLIKK